jgi:hypothetical protein
MSADDDSEPEPTMTAPTADPASAPVDQMAPGSDAGEVPEEPEIAVEPSTEPVVGPPMDPDPMDAGVPPSPDPEPPAEGAARLLYVGSPMPLILNVEDGTGWAELTWSISFQDGATPWSRDGSMLIDRRGDTIVFRTRVADGFMEGALVDLPGSPSRWLGNVGVVVPIESELWIVRPDGTTELVTDELGPIAMTGSSPDGTHLFFATANDSVYTLYHVGFEGGVASEIHDLSVLGASPFLSQLWSADERYFIFGISGGDSSGIYAFDTESVTATRLTPEGAAYNPLYSFAGDSNRLVIYTTLAEPELAVVDLDQGMTWQTVRSGGSTTPGDWSPDGTMLLHGLDGDAELVPVGTDGVIGTPIPFPEGRYGCPLLWMSAADFYFSCAGDGALWHGTIEGATVATELALEGILPSLVRAPSGRCAVNSSQSEVALISLSSGYQETSRLASDVPVQFTFPGDDSGVAWTEAGAVRWQAWDDGCQPTDDLLFRVGDSVSALAFLP